MSKKTLYITFDGLTDPLGQSQILPYLIGIANNGFSINILSCEKEVPLLKEKQTVLNLISNLPITWQYIIYNEKGNFITRFLYLRKLIAITKKLHTKNNFQLIHCRSYIAALIGLRFKLKYSIPFVFDMRGFWVDERIDGGIWKKTNPLHLFFYYYFKKKEKQFLIHSNSIISVTHSGIVELKKLYPSLLNTKKTAVIPCCTNTNLFDKNSLNLSLKFEGISANDHLLVYAGSIGTWYFTKQMIDCVLVWKSLIPNIKLLIITKDIGALSQITNQYSENVNEIIIVKSSTYQNIPHYLSVAKAAIFFIKPSYSKIASSPTKMAECWAMDLPIITNSGSGDNDLYFKNNEGGVLINNFTTKDYENACKKYLEISLQKNNYRNIALANFDTEDAIKKYTDIYKSLTT